MISLFARKWSRRFWRAYGERSANGNRQRQLLVDVSNFVRVDAGTGIQRVVRALLKEIVGTAPSDIAVRPVFATRHRGFRYIPSDTHVSHIVSRDALVALANKPVRVGPGDHFLGLDLAANIIPHRRNELRRWKRAGVGMSFVVYDVLPISHPDWFEAKTSANFRRWFADLRNLADTLICISHTVREAVESLLGGHSGEPIPQLSVIPMGGDLNGSVPSTGLPSDANDVFRWMAAHRASMVVGTLEPRKGHSIVLRAFEEIWRERPSGDEALLFVGRPGWRTDELQRSIEQHPEFGKRLLWVRGASDEMLGCLYERAAGLIYPSMGEGFGLPVLEGLQFGQKILARDLPVFREFAGNDIVYFEDDRAEVFAKSITHWLEAPTMGKSRRAQLWSDAGTALWQILKHKPLSPASNQTGYR